jgi:hypothetical protein
MDVDITAGIYFVELLNIKANSWFVFFPVKCLVLK